MESVSPAEIHVHTFGPLQLPMMSVLLLLLTTVPAQIFTMLDLQHSRQVLLELTTFVTPALQRAGSLDSILMILYGMELVVDQPTPAAH